MAREALESGRAGRALEAIVEAQGPVELPSAAAFRTTIESRREGRIQSVDCLGINRIAKLAGSPAHPAAGMTCLRRVGDVVRKNDPLFEIHAQSRSQLDMASEYATSALSKIVRYGY
jgi:thymidine phosphorylase